MAISRPFLLALLGVALLGATVFAVQNARNGADPAPVANQPAQPAQAAEQAAPSPTPADPKQLLLEAVASESDSAAFDAKLTFSSLGETNLIRATGAYELHGGREMPEVDVELSLRVPSMSMNERGGFVTTGERAWFTRGDAAYAVPQSAWSEIVEARESGAEPSADAANDLSISGADWVRNVKNEGTEQVAGVETTHISAEVDSAKAVTDVIRAYGEAGGSSLPLPNAEQRLRQAGLQDGKLDVWVGEDKVLRRITASLTGKGDGGRPVTAELELELSGVNEPQDIARPANVKAGLPGGTYGQVANGLITSVAEEVGANPEDVNITVPVTNGHLKAERAVADNRKVVIFFQNPRALDDKATAESVRALDRRTDKVVVVTDDVRNVKRYGSLLEDLGVSQAPAIVVIDRRGKASLVEGYVDGPSLAQVVADAR